ncbi:MAG: porin [Campylobacterota bacterium]|nr:porin [Campylobacterota bacterium]
MKTITRTLLSLATLTAITQAGGNIDTLTPLTEVIPEAQGSALDKISFGGYGKMDYTNYLDKDGSDKLDIYRFIMYVGYQFTDNIKLVSEIEWEHGGREKTGGYGIVEQAYLDFKVNEALSVKVGHVLVPVGMVNLYHEPTAFYSVARPETEKHIVPSTWHENGLIAHGTMGSFSYQAGIVAGLNAVNKTDDGQEVISSIRSMRQNGQKSKAEDFAFVGRLDYKAAGFNLGGSYFTGEAGQGSGIDVTTTVAEVHAGFSYEGFNIKGLYAVNEIDDSTGSQSKEGAGYYVMAGYTIGEFTPFAQYEAYSKDDTKDDIEITTVGINYNPTPNVVLKADYVMYDNRGTDDNRFELGMGYNF